VVSVWHKVIILRLVIIQIWNILIQYTFWSETRPLSFDTCWISVTFQLKVKVKLSLCFNWASHPEGVLAEWRCNSTRSLTSALDGGECSASWPCRFTPRARARYSLHRRLGGPQSQSGHGGKSKVVPVLFLTEHRAMKAYWGSGGIVPRIIWPRHEMEVSG
jgi:hypothetical protein